MYDFINLPFAEVERQSRSRFYSDSAFSLKNYRVMDELVYKAKGVKKKFGLILPNKGRPYGNPDVMLELALSAERAGWEGFFIWDHIGGGWR